MESIASVFVFYEASIMIDSESRYQDTDTLSISNNVRRESIYIVIHKNMKSDQLSDYGNSSTLT
jgi:hypothetical protein